MTRALAATVVALFLTACSSSSSSSSTRLTCVPNGTYRFSTVFDPSDSNSSAPTCAHDLVGATLALHYGGPSNADAGPLEQDPYDGGVSPGAATSTLDITSGNDTTTVTCYDVTVTCNYLEVLCSTLGIHILIGAYQYVEQEDGLPGETCGVDSYDIQMLTTP